MGEKLASVSTAEVNTISMLDEVKKFKEGEVSRLQGEVFAEESRLSSLKSQIEEAGKDARYQQTIERQKFEQNLQAQHHRLQDERKAIEALDVTLSARLKEVEMLEEKAKPVQDALKHLADERIAIEQQRLRNEELTKENDRLANEVSARHQEVTDLRTTLEQELAKVRSQASLQNTQQEVLDQQAKDVRLQIENLTSLKATIDPKLAEISERQSKAEADREQAALLYDATTKKEAELEKQRSDLSILSSQLEAKSEALTEYSLRLKRAESELRIKIQTTGVSVDVPESPVSA